ncbi:MAG: desampylase [Haloarculaceae archaeon]
MTTISFTRDAYDAVVDHAHEGAPEEVCGVLGGTDGDAARVTTVRRAANVAASPRTAYALDPGEQLAAMESIEAAGDDVVGFYHSHPDGPAGPSRTDAERATWPGASYVIVVLDGAHPFVGSWRWTGDGFDGERVTRA